ncbi:Na+/H+ antiporter subunit G [Lamprobacter modestohalophilus]|uniref:Na+/H+ antiporter subunit G n=1 Tax=Lamprobacter modestohalophilus TaxID=1064514 RepID=UPI002ADEFA49|nr:Na+/H+ antiporter subunit G [Lamprobacter modestohalophilus]MEA1050163.1 Na+/H+ antiporter subunit G [Lamprobacter modestohalophilus]
MTTELITLLVELFVALLVLIGAGFTLLGSFGLVRLRDLYERLHTPTKATTLGVGSLLIASAVFFTWREPGVSLHEVLVAVFLFITAPVSAHLIAKAALHQRTPSQSGLPPETLLEKHDGHGAKPKPDAEAKQKPF